MTDTPDTPQGGGAFGAGGFDMSSLLQQAQQMQQQLLDAQSELADTTVDGTAGGGLVTVTVDGTGDLVDLSIKAGSFDPDDTADLCDLILAAYRDAKAQAEKMASAKLGPLTGGFGEGLGPPGV